MEAIKLLSLKKENYFGFDFSLSLRYCRQNFLIQRYTRQGVPVPEDFHFRLVDNHFHYGIDHLPLKGRVGDGQIGSWAGFPVILEFYPKLNSHH